MNALNFPGRRLAGIFTAVHGIVLVLLERYVTVWLEVANYDLTCDPIKIKFEKLIIAIVTWAN